MNQFPFNIYTVQLFLVINLDIFRAVKSPSPSLPLFAFLCSTSLTLLGHLDSRCRQGNGLTATKLKELRFVIDDIRLISDRLN